MTIGNRIAKLSLELLFLVSPALLLFAPFYNGGYSYFVALRWIVFSESAYFSLMTAIQQDGYISSPRSPYPVVFLILAILFNPIIPITLDRGIWSWIDVSSGLFFLFYFIERKIFHRTNPEQIVRIQEIDVRLQKEHDLVKNLRWCRTCQNYQKAKFYENSTSDLRRQAEKPADVDLPCQIAHVATETWENFYALTPGDRTLYPKECSYWKKK